MSALPAQHASPPQDNEIAHLAAGYTYTQRLMEMTGVTLFFCLATIVAAHFVATCMAYSVPTVKIVTLVLASSVSALLFADLASGLVHWAADNWGRADWPIVGAAFIRPFRLHHLDKQDITRHTWLELNGNNCIVSLPTFLGAYYALEPTTWGLFWAGFWFFTAFWVLGTNQFHAWAHTDVPPESVQFLQRLRLILSTPHHEVHHAMPHNGNYCITTGWLNGPLRSIRFFESIEWTVTKVTGVRPNHYHLQQVVANSKGNAPTPAQLLGTLS